MSESRERFELLADRYNAKAVEVKRLRAALHAIAFMGTTEPYWSCEDVGDVGDFTCLAKAPTDPDEWCPGCIAAAALTEGAS